ncbi:MAG: 30S ribosomal protein S6 [Oscillospiraceae bacterium]|nr:30S ribosomal protein S6 [Oscillospiraceae bacterium]
MSNFAEYETMFIVDASLDSDVISEIIEKFKALIASNGEVLNVSEWGKRKLAYPINHKTEGYYCVVTFSAPPGFPAELERIFRITDSVVRSLTIKKGK